MIEVKRFVFNPLQENTYILYAKNGDCAIVDPGCNSREEEKMLSDFISENDLKPLYLVNTHGHFDHILGNSFVKATYGVDLYAHAEDEFIIENLVASANYYSMDATKSPKVDKYLVEGDTLKLGDEFLAVYHLPGHSPGSIGLYYAAEPFAIVGDVLFKGSIGRTDLPKGDYDVLMHSIRKKLFEYPDETIVYSGHGPTTTIGMELKTNPFLF